MQYGYITSTYNFMLPIIGPIHQQNNAINKINQLTDSN